MSSGRGFPVIAAGLAEPRSASAQAPCWERVADDWSDGAITGVYPVKCYRQALHRLPEDMLLYSSASDDIGRALASRVLSTRYVGQPDGSCCR